MARIIDQHGWPAGPGPAGWACLLAHVDSIAGAHITLFSWCLQLVVHVDSIAGAPITPVLASSFMEAASAALQAAEALLADTSAGALPVRGAAVSEAAVESALADLAAAKRDYIERHTMLGLADTLAVEEPLEGLDEAIAFQGTCAARFSANQPPSDPSKHSGARAPLPTLQRLLWRRVRLPCAVTNTSWRPRARRSQPCARPCVCSRMRCRPRARSWRRRRGCSSRCARPHLCCLGILAHVYWREKE